MELGSWIRIAGSWAVEYPRAWRMVGAASAIRPAHGRGRREREIFAARREK
jgi:hypothetical protein